MSHAGWGEVAEKLRRLTVGVSISGQGHGSGVVWTQDGVVVTNAHVVSGKNAHVELWNGQTLPARVLSSDARRDLAMLKIEATGLAVTSRDSASLRPGELVIAVGNPLGFTGAVSTGVVHGVGALRGIRSGPWVMSSVRLAPGNSGGPLADASGSIIGINTMIAGRLALAIPTEAVLRFLGGATDSSVELGIVARPVPNAGAIGLRILEITPGSAAERASLREGDVLTGAGGRPFRAVADLESAIQAAAGAALSLAFIRAPHTAVRTVVARIDRTAVKAA